MISLGAEPVALGAYERSCSRGRCRNRHSSSEQLEELPSPWSGVSACDPRPKARKRLRPRTRMQDSKRPWPTETTTKSTTKERPTGTADHDYDEDYDKDRAQRLAKTKTMAAPVSGRKSVRAPRPSYGLDKQSLF